MRWLVLLLSLLALGGFACTELGDESPFPHREPPPDASPADAAEEAVAG
jgi:hypothetical protein